MLTRIDLTTRARIVLPSAGYGDFILCLSGFLAKNIWYTTNVLWILEANKIVGRNRVLKKKLGFNEP